MLSSYERVITLAICSVFFSPHIEGYTVLWSFKVGKSNKYVFQITLRNRRLSGQTERIGTHGRMHGILYCIALGKINETTRNRQPCGYCVTNIYGILSIGFAIRVDWFYFEYSQRSKKRFRTRSTDRCHVRSDRRTIHTFDTVQYCVRFVRIFF